MPQIYFIDDAWQEQSWFSTGGTRAKEYLASPNGEYFYFKQSEYKPAHGNRPEKNYEYEFWSEIISFEIGTLLGFEVLRYDIAINKYKIGCICKSMINSDEEELVEAVKYLKGFDNSFNPEINSLRNKYSFQLIQQSFERFGLDKYMDRFIEIVVFDAIIGNGDRHQENWAFINKFSTVSFGIDQLQKDFPLLGNEKVPIWLKKMGEWILAQFKKHANKEVAEIIKLTSTTIQRFAPIYDSGSSLGRELVPHKIDEFLKNEIQLNAYILKGKSEIHWDGAKVDHFTFIRNLVQSSYHEIVKNIINRVLQKFDKGKIEELILKIDSGLPENLYNHKIPENRKQLISKLITLRIQKLGEILNEGI